MRASKCKSLLANIFKSVLICFKSSNDRNRFSLYRSITLKMPQSLLPGGKHWLPHVGVKPENNVDSSKKGCTLCQTDSVLYNGVIVSFTHFFTGAA